MALAVILIWKEWQPTYAVYQHMHHGIGVTRPAKPLRLFRRRKAARKFARK